MIKFITVSNSKVLVNFDSVDCLTESPDGEMVVHYGDSDWQSIHEKDKERVWEQYEDYLLRKKRAVIINSYWSGTDSGRNIDFGDIALRGFEAKDKDKE